VSYQDILLCYASFPSLVLNRAGFPKHRSNGFKETEIIRISEMTKASRSAVLLRNIASNWVGFAVNAAVTLVLTPYVLRELGVERYGIWILTSSLIGYYGFLDLGFRGGIAQYMTRYLAVEDYKKGSECLSSAVAVLSLLGLAMAVLSIAGAYAVSHLFSIPPDMHREAFWCVLVVGMSSAAECFFSPFGSVFVAKQRFDLSNLIGIGTRLLTAGGIVAALKTGNGLVGVSVAFCGANVIDYLTRWQVARRLEPKVKVSWSLANLSRLREIASFGAWNFLMSLNCYVCTYVPNMLIGTFMPVAAVGHYALATGLYRQVNSVLSPVPQVIYPAATEMHVQGNLVGLESLYHKASRLMMLIMIPVVLLAAFWADDFYRLWIGDKYLSGDPFTSVAVIFQILLIGTATSFVATIAVQIIMGTGNIRTVATALIFGSIINLSLSLILLRPYGLPGVAAATVVTSVVIDLIVIPLLLQKLLGFKVFLLFKNACIRPLLAGVLQAVIMSSLKLTGQPETLVQLVFQGILAGAGAVTVLFLVGLTREDRQRFVFEPLRRIMCRLNMNTLNS